MTAIQSIKIERCWPTKVGLELAPDLELKDWLSIGSQLMEVGSAYQWLIGDWLNYGQRKYGEKYAIACDEMGIAYQTAANWASIAGRIEFSRRRENLSFSHHAEVADLDSPKEQNKWLEKAEQGKWSVADLRENMRKAAANFAGEDHGEPVATFTGFIARAVKLISKNSDAVGSWTQEQRNRTAELLRPIVEFYEKLTAKELQ